MSDLSKLLHKTLGLPEVNLVKHEDIGKFVDEVIKEGHGHEVLKFVSDENLDRLLEAIETEQERRTTDSG